MIIPAIVTISLALVLYSIGIWAEKIQHSLKKRHLLCVWSGLVFDTAGSFIYSSKLYFLPGSFTRGKSVSLNCILLPPPL